MAELFASPLIKLVLGKLGSELWTELKSLRSVNEDIEKLRSKLSTINDVLEGAENRLVYDNKPLCNWLKKLRDAAFDADDVVDEFLTEVTRRMVKKHDSLRGQVRDFLSRSHNPPKFRQEISMKIKEVTKRLDEIAKEKDKFHIPGGTIYQRPEDRQTHSAVESKVYGRDEEKEMVVNFLLNHDDDNNDIPVLPIFGLGGIGKTTLAKLAYNDERVKPLFDLHIWVCISDEFDVKRIIRDILECIPKKKCDPSLKLESLRRNLEETVCGKRFLLVLDDVWNEDEHKWQDLKSLLVAYGKKGSKIVVTTRSERVVTIMGSVSALSLQVLSEDHCWVLFKERAFGPGREKETPIFVEIGRKIVSKCGGLPLAAKAMGSLMGSRKGEAEWIAVQNSEIWRLYDEDKILPALKLSYYHLPPHLKQCFTYCALFPKDYKFSKDELINLWIGEGFVSSLIDEGMCPEDVGNRYFNILLGRSFFQQGATSVPNIELYVMHDLVHDLACYFGKDELFMMDISKEVKLSNSCRYLSVINDGKSPGILDLSTQTILTRRLRSLILLQSWPSSIEDINSGMLQNLKCLRLLDLSCDRPEAFPLLYLSCYSSHCNGNISVIPDNICKLKHLRFLDLSWSSIATLPTTIGSLYNLSRLILRHCSLLKELPSSIGSLYNLSALILAYCEELEELPSTISRLHNLYTLDLTGCNIRKLPGGVGNMKNLRRLLTDILPDFPPGIGRLSNLQMLPLFIVGDEDGHHISELQHLNQIRGSLKIKNLHKVKNPGEANEANLSAKIHVKELQLYWDWTCQREEASLEEEEIMESLKPPSNIEELQIVCYLGTRFPSWIMSNAMDLPSSSSLFQNLVTLKLVRLERCEGLPPLGQLPSLKTLHLVILPGLRKIGGNEFYGQEAAGGGGRVPFPSLEKLILSNLVNLEEWVVETGEVERERMFPSLEDLKIANCPKLTRVQPGLPMSVRNLDLYSLDGTILSSLSCLTSLETLQISDFDGITCLPEGIIQLHFPSLRTLILSGNRNLTTLGVRDPQQQQQQPPLLFISLHYLEILACFALSALPEWMGGLTSLQRLQQQQPPLLFISLHRLEIKCCDALSALPEWMGGLTSLRSLHLSNCHKLEMLPDGLQCLTELRDLQIYGCQLVERRLHRETGEDWHKIAHIPRIRIA